MAVSQRLRNLTLPVSMVIGGLFYSFFDKLTFSLPYFIFLMLFVTSTAISPRDIKFKKLHLILLLIQLLGGVAVYFALLWFDRTVAQGLMIVVFAPAAIASTVIAAILGANRVTVASFCLISNVSVAFLAPMLFSLIGANSELTFLESTWTILSKVCPLIILPFVLAWTLEYLLPKVHSHVRKRQSISFVLWAVSLTIVTGSTVKFIIEQPQSNFTAEILLGAGALILCLAQFSIGKRVGRRNGEEIAGGQSLGQKNTLLAIWMAQTYFNPLVSLAPASYVIWQNVVNSLQIYKSAKSKRK